MAKPVRGAHSIIDQIDMDLQEVAAIQASRGGGAVARFTSQLVALVVPDRKDRVVALSERHGVSQATIMRTVVEHGLPLVEQKLADGTLDATTLA